MQTAICLRSSQNHSFKFVPDAIPSIRCRPVRLGYVFRPRCYNTLQMSHRTGYTEHHAKAGLDHQFPEIDTWPNQFPGYEIIIDIPEFTSVCPKTGLPDFGTLEIRYMPSRLCLELKSLKEYLLHYRNLGIFQENIVNRVLDDIVQAARPTWAVVKGAFRPRGGIGTTVEARWPRPKK